MQTENRYKVRKGTKFYRVKVKPLATKESGRVSQHLSHMMSQSQTTGHSVTDKIAELSASHSLPSTPTKLHLQLSTKSSVSRIQKSDTETLMMQTSHLMSQSANLLKEIQKNIPVSAIDTSQIIVHSSVFTENPDETLEDSQLSDELVDSSIPTDTLVKAAPLQTSEISTTKISAIGDQVQDDKIDSITSNDADCMNTLESASNR